MTTKRLIACLAWVATLVVARDAAADWTFGAFLGGTRTQDASLTIRQPDAQTDVTLTSIHYDSESLQAPPYYGYRVGFFPDRFLGASWLGIEGEFIHMKVIADTNRTAAIRGTLRGAPIDDTRPVRNAIERFSITHGMNLVFVNAVARLQARDRDDAGRARWMLVGRVGAGPSVPHPESTIGGRSLERYEWGALGIQGAAGVELRVRGPLYVTSEYKLTRTVQDVTIADGGRARTPVVSHHLAVGLSVHVGSSSRRRP